MQASTHVLKIYNSREHKCARNMLFWFADLSRKQSAWESSDIANGNHFGAELLGLKCFLKKIRFTLHNVSILLKCYGLHLSSMCTFPLDWHQNNKKVNSVDKWGFITASIDTIYINILKKTQQIDAHDRWTAEINSKLGLKGCDWIKSICFSGV